MDSGPDTGRRLWRIGSVGDIGAPSTVYEREGQLFELDALISATGMPAGADTTVRGILNDWPVWQPRLSALATGADEAPALDRAALNWLPPVVYPRKIVICGANYRAHVLEMGADPDALDHPFTLLKPATTSLVGHRQPIVVPKQVTWIDWEGELGVVIGRRVRHLALDDALTAVAGYCPVNDVSARDWVDAQVPGVGMDWTLHKGFDGFTPAGPLITPAEFVDDPQQLDIELTVNGVTKQATSTSDMIFGVARLIAYLTSVMTLEPGDMLLTGSPAGVGFGRTPRERLMPGDEVVVSVSGVGTLSNPVTAETDN
jgi:2-keto-4-pentenoate hydratase/2-oxohepta-3-ene-1,7-dioic acid hydratase in catechol pathway